MPIKERIAYANKNKDSGTCQQIYDGAISAKIAYKLATNKKLVAKAKKKNANSVWNDPVKSATAVAYYKSSYVSLRRELRERCPAKYTKLNEKLKI